jgi:hypothetical protein
MRILFRSLLAIAMIALFHSQAWSVPLNGRRSFTDAVEGHSLKTYTELFVPGMLVDVILNGYCDRYSDVDLNLYVYDSRGKIVAKSENPTCWEEISFSPQRKERYEIVVRSAN